MGGYFSEYQGFDKDISLAISEQYLPIGFNSIVPKKPFSVTLSITDKIDTLVGFFGINEKPTSSKDPLALRCEQSVESGMPGVTAPSGDCATCCGQ